MSNATQVTLRNVGFNLSGNFTCEVTADAPSFHTSVVTSALVVVAFKLKNTQNYQNRNITNDDKTAIISRRRQP
ncbi:unnamed protein product [Hermetia illucens]|uniref:Uncharacterized protein n=1 Tax=Hermetia illucens TaxID=343691 RepID=A0A7R8UN43_HERIL|nr:unnamed protein product [Hermetia illucens]